MKYMHGLLVIDDIIFIDLYYEFNLEQYLKVNEWYESFNDTLYLTNNFSIKPNTFILTKIDEENNPINFDVKQKLKTREPLLVIIVPIAVTNEFFGLKINSFI